MVPNFPSGMGIFGFGLRCGLYLVGRWCPLLSSSIWPDQCILCPLVVSDILPFFFLVVLCNLAEGVKERPNNANLVLSAFGYLAFC